MAFPTTIDNILGLSLSVVAGPYQDATNSNIFAVLVDGIANTGDLQTYISTDSGITWAIADTAHHPVIATAGGFAGLSFGASYDSSARKIDIIYSNSSPGFSFINFDTAVSTWGTPINSGSGTQYLGTQVGGSTNGDVWGGNPEIVMTPLGGGTYITAYSAQAHFQLFDEFSYVLTFVFNGSTFSSPVILYADPVLDNSLTTASSDYPIGITAINGSQAVIITQGYLNQGGNLINYNVHSWVIDGTTSQLGGSTLVTSTGASGLQEVSVGYTASGTLYVPYSDDTNLNLYSSPYPSLSWTQTIIGPIDFSFSALVSGTTSYIFGGNGDNIHMYTNTGLGWSSQITLYNSPDTYILTVSGQTINGTDAIVFDDVDNATFSVYKTKYFTGIITTPTFGLVLGPLNLTY